MKDLDKNENSFSIWRVVFTFAIMVFHLFEGTNFYDKYPWCSYHLYICVEFFFILSGYLLAQHVEKNPQETIGDYIKNRVIRLYPEYIVVFCILACIRAYSAGISIFKVLIPNWLEIFMLQSIGTNEFPYVNNPAWYVSALFLTSYILFYFIVYHRDFFIKIGGFLIIIISYSYLFRTNRSLQPFIQTDGIWVNHAVIRALMEMTIGIFVFYLSNLLKEKANCYVIILCEMFCFIGGTVFAILIEDQEYDFFICLLFAIGVLCASLDKRLANIASNKVIGFLAKQSFSMYLIHFATLFCMSLFIAMYDFRWTIIPIYYFVTIILSCIVSFVAKRVRRRLLICLDNVFSRNKA